VSPTGGKSNAKRDFETERFGVFANNQVDSRVIRLGMANAMLATGIKNR
jgi:hypothetical protein